MNLVIDAHLIAGYFREAERGEVPPYTGSALTLIARLGATDTAYADAEQILEQEYRDLVDPDWFDAWYGQRLEDGDVLLVKKVKCADLINSLATSYGFPKRGRDRHYVATAKAVVDSGARVAIVSEDLDFFDPRSKGRGSKTRDRVLARQRGPVATYLRRETGIEVRTVAGHLAATAD